MQSGRFARTGTMARSVFSDFGDDAYSRVGSVQPSNGYQAKVGIAIAQTLSDSRTDPQELTIRAAVKPGPRFKAPPGVQLIREVEVLEGPFYCPMVSAL